MRALLRKPFLLGGGFRAEEDYSALLVVLISDCNIDGEKAAAAANREGLKTL